jgi:hypothetical protein
MNSKEFDDGLQVEIEISEKVPKSLMRHLPALHLTRFRACPACPALGRDRGREAGGRAVFPRPSIKNFLENGFQFI